MELHIYNARLPVPRSAKRRRCQASIDVRLNCGLPPDVQNILTFRALLADGTQEVRFERAVAT
jgi:hypothetical protein